MSLVILCSLAALAFIGRHSKRKPVSFSTRIFSPGEKNTPQGPDPVKKPRTLMERPMASEHDFKTWEQVKAENIRKYANPDYDAWSPENRQRTEELGAILRANQKIAEAEMKELIAKEEAERSLPTVEESVRELRAKQAKQRQIDDRIAQKILI